MKGLLRSFAEDKNLLKKVLDKYTFFAPIFVFDFKDILSLSATDIVNKRGPYFIALKEVGNDNFENILKEKIDISSFLELDYPYLPLSMLLMEAKNGSDDFSQLVYSIYTNISSPFSIPYGDEYEKITGIFLFFSLLIARTDFETKYEATAKSWKELFKALGLDLDLYKEKLKGDLSQLGKYEEEIKEYLIKNPYYGIKVSSYDKKQLFTLIDALSFIIYSNLDFLKMNFILNIYKATLIRLNTLIPETKNKPKKFRDKEEQLKNALIGVSPFKQKGRPRKYRSYRKILLAYYTWKILNKEMRKRNKVFEDTYTIKLPEEAFSTFFDIAPISVKPFIQDIKNKVRKNSDFF